MTKVTIVLLYINKLIFREQWLIGKRSRERLMRIYR